MTLEDIHDAWAEDAVIDASDLAGESFKIAQLHAKYWRVLTHERLSWEALKVAYAKLKKDKIEFYLHGPFKGDERGWECPSSGIIRQDLPLYLDADEDLVKLHSRSFLQKEKIELLLSIITSLNNRNWQISNSIKYLERMDGK